MKDHVYEERRVDMPYKEEPDAFFARISALCSDLVDPKIGFKHMWEDAELEVTGWRPMTERELEVAKKRRAAARVASKAKKEKQREAELAELARLKSKYE